MTPINEIRARLAACPIPEGARADWAGTNHYEIQTPFADDYWWLACVHDMFHVTRDWSATETGKRLGACLDYSCHYRDDVTPLQAKMYLMDELAKGHKVLPCVQCDNFSYQTGCGGHEVEMPSCQPEPDIHV